MRSRAAGAWGWVFAILLLLSAGMVTVPDRGDSVSTIRVFYENNGGLIVTAQLLGLLAALAFLPFAIALQRQVPVQDSSGTSPWIARAGMGVAGAAVVTAVPVVWLTAVIGGADDTLVRRLTQAADVSDVILFVAIAAFAASLLQARCVLWLEIASTLVLVASIARAALLLAGSAALEVEAPLSFVVLVLAVSTINLARRPLFRTVQHQAPRRSTAG